MPAKKSRAMRAHRLAAHDPEISLDPPSSTAGVVTTSMTLLR
jgi:hypothetical protein